MKTANLAIVFTDIKGFTERTSAQTHEENQKLLATHNALLSPLFKAFGGHIIKSIGDAFLVTFESPSGAVLAGVAVQDRLWQYNRGAPEKERLQVRVAINVGEVRLEDHDVFGEPVNIAARVEGIAEAGDVYFTEAVYLAMNKAEVPSVEVGQFELKGIPGKVRVYKVPHGPYRVEPAVEGAPPPPLPEDQPPYGNLGLSRVSEDKLKLATGAQALQEQAAQFASSAAGLAGKAMSGGSELLRAGVQGLQARGVPRDRLKTLAVGVLVVLLVGLFWANSKSELDKAIEAAAAAPPEERASKLDAADKLIAREPDAATRSLLSGRLAEAMGDASAATAYKQAAKGGNAKGEKRLIALLKHPKCGLRSAAASALADLKAKSAKGALEELAASGGPDDGEQVLIFGCNSKNAAASAVKRLEAAE
jgi:adenylate cyclase